MNDSAEPADVGPQAPADEAPRGRTRGRALIGALLCAAVGAWLARWTDPHVRTEVGPLTGTDLVAWRIEPVEVEPVGTALLLHGVTASAETMRALGEALARAGYRCVLLDVPGHGRTPGPVSRETLVDAVAAGAVALSDPQDPVVDVVIGHSMGGYLAAAALGDERLRARYVVSIGSRTKPDTLAGVPTLLISGALDPLLPPGELRALAAEAEPGHEVEAVPVALCDHVLEPFHPGLVDAVVARVVARLGGAVNPTLGGSVWALRLLGSALCLLAALLGLPLAVPRRAQAPTPQVAAGFGLVGGVTLLTGAALGIHGVYFYGLPGGAGWLGVPLCAAGATLGSLVLTRAVSRLARLETPRPGPAHGLGVGLCLAGGVAAMLLGARFPGMLLTLTGVAAGVGGGLATWVAARVGHPLAAHVAFGVCAGYVPGLWTRVFF